MEGYFIPASASLPAGEYHPIAPIRVCDTRAGQPATMRATTTMMANPTRLARTPRSRWLSRGRPRTAALSTCPPNDFIPTDGTAENAIINLTAIAGTSNTFLSIVPFTTTGCQFGGTKAAPSYSDVNVNAGGVQANRVFVPLGPGTSPINVCVYNAAGKANFIIDANGWFGGRSAPHATGLQYVATTPTRICDTRSGNGHSVLRAPAASGRRPDGGSGWLDGISSSAKAIIANLTAVDGTSFTFLSAYPSDATSRPNVSDVNVAAGQVLPNLTAITLSGGGSPGDFNLFNGLGRIDAIVDVEGWFQ